MGPISSFSRYPVHGSAGVNVFAQPCPRGQELYVFPPFVLFPSLNKLFCEWGDIVVTWVVPKHKHQGSWRPLKSSAGRSLRLSEPDRIGFWKFRTHAVTGATKQVSHLNYGHLLSRKRKEAKGDQGVCGSATQCCWWLIPCSKGWFPLVGLLLWMSRWKSVGGLRWKHFVE